MSNIPKKILVTGGAGYIGSHAVVELASAGYEPVIIDNFCNSNKSVVERLSKLIGEEPKVYEADCSDPIVLRKVFQQESNIGGVIHFAALKSVAESIRQPLRYYQNNIGSTLALLQVMEEFEIQKLVFSSSCTVYGEPQIVPVTEETAWQTATSPYGYSKQVCERAITDSVLASKLQQAALLRYFNPIGAHPSGLIGEQVEGEPANLVPYIMQVAAKVRPTLKIFGNDYDTPDGTCIRDYIHVVDLARAHIKALEWLSAAPAQVTEIFNIGTGQGVSLLEIVGSFKKSVGVPLPYEFADRRPGDIERIYADTAKVSRVLDWQPTKTLEDALRDGWRWQKNLEQ